MTITENLTSFTRHADKPARHATPDYVGTFYTRAIAGLADYDARNGSSLVSGFVIDDDDTAQFPVLFGAFAIVVWENSDGFVGHTLMDWDAWHTWHRACEGVDYSGDEWSDD